MPQVEMATYRRVSREIPEKKERKNKIIGRKDILTAVIGFFVAMAMPYPSMAPFGISYLAGERRLTIRAILVFAAVSLGAVVSCDRIDAAKYIGAGLIYLTILFVLEKGIKMSETASAISAACSVAITGFTALYWRGVSVDTVLLMLCEAAAVAAGVFVIEKSRRVTSEGMLVGSKLTGEDRLSLAAVGAMVLMGLKEIYLGYSFSVMHMAAAVVILTVGAGCGAMYATGCGVLLGVLCGIGTDYFMPVLGAFSFCGFIAGIFEKFGRGGVIAGLVLANAVLVVYTNGAMENMLSIYEIMAATVIYLIIPKRITAAVSGVIKFDENSRESVAKLKENIRGKLSAVAATFEDMSGTLSRLSDKENEADISDVAVLFDSAADKICRDCRRAPVCWGKEFNSTYKVMFRLLEVMEENGEITEEDMDEYFRARCLNRPKLIGELMRQFDIYQVRRIWKSKLAESRELVGDQLHGVSQIINSIADEIEDSNEYDALSAEDIRVRLEGKGIHIRDINVYKDRYGKYRVELVVKRTFLKEGSERTIKNIMRVALGRNISMRENVQEDNRFVRFDFCEEERFRVEAGHATLGASEKSGDNYSFSHLGCGKYVIIISDGMGTGHRASRESRAIIELLDGFLRAGYDSRTAVRLINSIMIMKSEKEAFVTIDMCIIDLYTGEAEFIKTGAEPSYIMTSGGVDMVRACSLPVGVMTELESEVIKKQLEDGDAVIMMSDGVESRKDGDGWIKGYIGRSRALGTVEDISNGILRRAVEENDGKVQDDITVVSVRLRSRNEISGAT